MIFMGRVHSLIVGGTHGIGNVLVQEWSVDQAHTLSVIGRRLKTRSAESEHLHYYLADLLNPKELQHSLKKILLKNDKIDNIVFFQRYRGDKDKWHGELETSLTATKHIIEMAARSFGAHGPKSIVVVGSIADRLVADDCEAGYHVAKAGLRQLVRYFAVRLAPLGIRVNCVTPGAVLKDEALDFYRRHKKRMDSYQALTPLGRMATPDDVIRAIEFLCSRNASFITGQNIVVDGGLSLRWQGSFAKS